MKSLSKHFHVYRVACKSIANIMKKYFSRTFAMQVTVSKQMPNKFIMKDTPFYDCLLGKNGNLFDI